MATESELDDLRGPFQPKPFYDSKYGHCSLLFSDFFLFNGGYISSSGVFFSHLFSRIINMNNRKLFRIVESLLKAVC